LVKNQKALEIIPVQIVIICAHERGIPLKPISTFGDVYTAREDSQSDAGFFIEQSHLNLRVLLAIIYLFSLKIPLKICEKLFCIVVSNRVLIDWFNFCRDVMAMRLRRNPIKLGGPGIKFTCLRHFARAFRQIFPT